MLLEGSLAMPASTAKTLEVEVEGVQQESSIRCCKHFALLALLLID